MVLGISLNNKGNASADTCSEDECCARCDTQIHPSTSNEPSQVSCLKLFAKVTAEYATCHLKNRFWKFCKAVETITSLFVYFVFLS